MKTKEMEKLRETKKFFIIEGKKDCVGDGAKLTPKPEAMLDKGIEGFFYDLKGDILGLLVPLADKDVNDFGTVNSMLLMKTVSKSSEMTLRLGKEAEIFIVDSTSGMEVSLGKMDLDGKGINFTKRAEYKTTVCIEQMDTAYAFVALPDEALDTLKAIVPSVKIGNYNISAGLFNLLDNKHLSTLKASDFIFKENNKLNVVNKVLAHLLTRKQVRLVGPPSSGKNVLAEDIGKILNLPVVNVACTSDMDATDFFYSTELIDGDTKHVPSELVKAFEHGGVVVVDEFNSASADVLIALHSLLDDREIIEIQKINGGKAIKRHKNCYFIFTMNEGTAGTKELNTALESRMSTIFVDRMADIKQILKTPIDVNGTIMTPDKDNVELFARLYKQVSSKMEQNSFTEAHVSIRQYKAALKTLTVSPELGFVQAAEMIAYASTDNEYAISDIKGIIDEVSDKYVTKF